MVDFFNTHFGYNESYGQGFPSRWYFILDKFVDLINMKKIDTFFSLVLSKRYLMVEKQISEVNAVVLSEQIHQVLNYLKSNGFIIIKNEGKFELVSVGNVLEFVGEGRFAVVYRRRSNGLIVKK